MHQVGSFLDDAVDTTIIDIAASFRCLDMSCPGDCLLAAFVHLPCSRSVDVEVSPA